MRQLLGMALLAAGAGFSLGTQGQTVYRCGNSYQDQPCERGQKGRIVGGTAPGPAAGAPAKTAAELEEERVRSREQSVDLAQKSRCAMLNSQYDDARRRPAGPDFGPEQLQSAIRAAEAQLKLAGCAYD
jgi:hypothetical protein